MKPVSNWRDAWRWFSVRFAALGAAVSVAWLALPADLTAQVPGWVQNAVAGVIFVGVLLGRLIDQRARQPNGVAE